MSLIFDSRHVVYVFRVRHSSCVFLYLRNQISFAVSWLLHTATNKFKNCVEMLRLHFYERLKLCLLFLCLLLNVLWHFLYFDKSIFFVLRHYSVQLSQLFFSNKHLQTWTHLWEPLEKMLKNWFHFIYFYCSNIILP